MATRARAYLALWTDNTPGRSGRFNSEFWTDQHYAETTAVQNDGFVIELTPTQIKEFHKAGII